MGGWGGEGGGQLGWRGRWAAGVARAVGSWRGEDGGAAAVSLNREAGGWNSSLLLSVAV